MKTFLSVRFAAGCVLGMALAVTPAETLAREPKNSALSQPKKSRADAKTKKKSRRAAEEKDKAATMTGIALAESGGRTKKKRGATLGVKKKTPKQAELSPWTVTHSSNPRTDRKPKKKKLSY